MPVILKEQEQKIVGCYECHAKIGYFLNEVRQDYNSDYLGGKDYYKYIVCPSCTNKIVLKWR